MKKKGFSLVELLVVIAILCLLAALLFPVYAQARRRADFASTAISLRQIGVATAQYMSDHDGYLPVHNFGYQEPWEQGADGRYPGYSPSDDPLAPYGARGWEMTDGRMGIRQSNNPMFCPADNRSYIYRWVFSIVDAANPHALPTEIRRVEPQPTSVLVRCPNLLTKGYETGNFPTTWTSFSELPSEREGRELLLRGDGSVTNVDTKAQRLLARRPIDGVDHWTEVDLAKPGAIFDVIGQTFAAFPGEAWPPEWTTIARPAKEKP